jgi:hypothetical protein
MSLQHKLNDVVLAADGQSLTDVESLTSRLDRVLAGGSIRLTILRARERREITLKPAS